LRERPPFETREVLTHCLVDYRLVAATSGVSAFAKPLQQLVVQVNAGPGLARLLNYWPTLPLLKS